MTGISPIKILTNEKGHKPTLHILDNFSALTHTPHECDVMSVHTHEDTILNTIITLHS